MWGGKKEWGKKAISKVREKWKCEKVKQKNEAHKMGVKTPLPATRDTSKHWVGVPKDHQ